MADVFNSIFRKLQRYGLLSASRPFIGRMFFRLIFKFTNKTFYCRALSGLSNYNLIINSDMTVSCNCCDYNGLGHIGDLNVETFENIFSSGKASDFRESLFKGMSPVPFCINCNDLCLTTKKDAKKYLKPLQMPKTIMIENTVTCNLNCTACKREEIYSIRNKLSLNVEDIEKISTEILKKNEMGFIPYFNQGEPFLSKKIKDELNVIKKHNPDLKIFTSTNGMLLNSLEKREAAMSFNHIYISLDGSKQEEVEKYQKGSDFEVVYNNIKELVKYRNSLNKKTPIVEWKYVLFSWNDSKESIHRAIKLAKNAGVDIISFFPTFNPRKAMSKKYFLGWLAGGNFFRKIGNKCWKGREVSFISEEERLKYDIFYQ